MYIVIREDNLYHIKIKGLENSKGIFNHYDKKLIHDICEMLNTSYYMGYNHGMQSV